MMKMVFNFNGAKCGERIVDVCVQNMGVSNVSRYNRRLDSHEELSSFVVWLRMKEARSENAWEDYVSKMREGEFCIRPWSFEDYAVHPVKFFESAARKGMTMGFAASASLAKAGLDRITCNQIVDKFSLLDDVFDNLVAPSDCKQLSDA